MRCKDCTIRYSGCHDQCSDYQALRTRNLALYQSRKVDSDNLFYLVNNKIKAARAAGLPVRNRTC